MEYRTPSALDTRFRGIYRQLTLLADSIVWIQGTQIVSGKDKLLESKGRSLEEGFFPKENRRPIENLRQEKETGESKEVLSEASGITNDAILEKFTELNIGTLI